MDYNSNYDLFALSKDIEIDIEDMVDIFNIYFIEVNDLILNLRHLSHNEDWDKFQKLLHNLKGISINLKLTDIYEMAVNFENLIKIQNFDLINCHINELQNLVSRAKLDINKFFSYNKI
ncbi:MAG: Hpt domain-containing protein [Maledivibacter sp.]|jgi:HPt (histidine-containing phosphotransfer) domain-containing protein|nr:Hpt domain-containing protein [Maledivibacter sp.]